MKNGNRKVFTDRPDYADFDSPHKFMAIEAIIARRLIEHPNATCSYSGGSDSDIMIDLIERVRNMHGLPPINYTYFNTGLEMDATKRHVKETAEKYGVKIDTVRPKLSVVNACHKYGLPFMSKNISKKLSIVQSHNIMHEILNIYESYDDKIQAVRYLLELYPKRYEDIKFLCNTRRDGMPFVAQFTIGSAPYLLDFIKQNPIPFRVSNKCCDVCKKQPAHEVEKHYDMTITGERFQEGGMRANITVNGTKCFSINASGKFRLRPLYYVSDADKAWYKDHYNVRYSDAYEIYGLKRTGCCGCAISSRAVEELEIIGKYEPQLVKAAWNVFGDSYRYRQAYNEYKAKRMAEDKAKAAQCKGQIEILDILKG